MTLAEKHFRSTYKIKPDVKITNEQWKVINMMHRCLKEYNTPKLPHGAILVDKKQFVDHLRYVKNCLNNTDSLMQHKDNKQFANSQGGKDLAKIWNALNLTMQSILHFQLNVPLERVCDEIEDIKELTD